MGIEFVRFFRLLNYRTRRI